MFAIGLGSRKAQIGDDQDEKSSSDPTPLATEAAPLVMRVKQV